jgi:hypothetical protein
MASYSEDIINIIIINTTIMDQCDDILRKQLIDVRLAPVTVIEAATSYYGGINQVYAAINSSRSDNGTVFDPSV